MATKIDNDQKHLRARVCALLLVCVPECWVRSKVQITEAIEVVQASQETRRHEMEVRTRARVRPWQTELR